MPTRWTRHGGDGVVAEDLAPAAERLGGGDDGTGGFVAGGDELGEQAGGLGLEGDAAGFVDDDEGVSAEAGDLGPQPGQAIWVAVSLVMTASPGSCGCGSGQAVPGRRL
jgi:hypothetical protein